jgi:hypothetical protein
MPNKSTALRRRVAPSVPLEISFSDENGSFAETFQVAFNLNVLAEISEKTGLTALGYDIWLHVDAKTLRAILWAALLPYQDDFDTYAKNGRRTDEGLKVVGSWLTPENQEKAATALYEAFLLYLPADEAARVRAERAEAEKAAAERAQAIAAGGEVPLAPGEAAKWIEASPPMDGSISGPSADTTSASPIAKSAS